MAHEVLSDVTCNDTVESIAKLEENTNGKAYKVVVALLVVVVKQLGTDSNTVEEKVLCDELFNG